jgi:hypothetical protein
MRMLRQPDPVVKLIDENMETVRRFEIVERQRHLLAAALGDALLATDLDTAHSAARDALKPLMILGQPGDEPSKWRDLLGQILDRTQP